MPGNYRDVIAATTTQPKKEYAGGLSRLFRVLLIPLAVWMWLAAAIVYALSLVAAMGGVATNYRYAIHWSDWLVIALLGGILVSFSTANRELPDLAKWMWIQLEDTIGRAAVYVYSITRISFPGNLRHLRKVVAWLAASIGLALLLICLRWTFAFAPAMSSDARGMTTLVRIAGSADTLIFALGLTLSSVIAALVWRLTFSGRWMWIFSPPQCLELTHNDLAPRIKDANIVRILHASDLHITDADGDVTVEGHRTISEAELTETIQTIAADAADCAAVLVTGDITDAGTATAWNRLLRATPASLIDKLILLPGNHDLNLQDRYLIRRAERLDGFGRKMRQVRAMCVMTEIMGNRAWLIDRRNNRRLTLSQYFERHRASIEGRVHGKSVIGPTINEIWSGMFPMVARVEGTDLGVLIVDSVKPASMGLTNAFGAVPPEVTAACAELMDRVADECKSFVFAMHHHIAIPGGGSLKDRLQDAGLVFENSAEFIEMLAERRDPTVVFHGHRHIEYVGRVEQTEIEVVASPSATLGGGRAGARGSWRIVSLQTKGSECRLASMPESRLVRRTVQRAA